MSEYRQLHRSFWESDYVREQLDPVGKLLYNYLITGPRSNMEGLYKCGLSRISDDTGIPKDKIRDLCNRLAADRKAGWNDGWVCVTQAAAHMPKSPQMMAHAKAVLSDTPEAILCWALKIGYTLPCTYRINTESHRQTDIQTNQPESDTVSIPKEVDLLMKTLPWRKAAGTGA